MKGDEIVGEKVKEVVEKNYIETVNEEVKVMLWCSEGGITGDPYKWMMEQRAEEVVRRRLRLSGSAFSEVDWEIHGDAIRRIAPRERVMVKKMLWDELPAGRKLFRNGFQTGSKCALCAVKDGQHHFLECEILNGTKEKKTTIGVVKGRMAKLDVNPFLSHWVTTSLCGKTPDLERERDLRIRHVVN